MDWIEKERAHRADLAAWEGASKEEREAYAKFIRMHAGTPSDAQALGEKPPPGPAEWLAQQRLQSAPRAPWQEMARQQAIEEAAKRPGDLLENIPEPKKPDGQVG